MRTILAAAVIVFLVVPTPTASATCDDTLSSMPGEELAPRNVRVTSDLYEFRSTEMTIRPIERGGTRGPPVAVDVVTLQNALVVTPVHLLEPDTVYEVQVLVDGGPGETSRFLTTRSIDEIAPTWAGVDAAWADVTMRDLFLRLRRPANAFRTLYGDFQLGVWPANPGRGFDPRAMPIAITNTFSGWVDTFPLESHRECGPPRWTPHAGPFWIAPIDRAGNVGTAQRVHVEITTSDEAWSRAFLSSEPGPSIHDLPRNHRWLARLTSPRLVALLAIPLLLILLRGSARRCSARCRSASV